jgi:hypothetical protein
MKWDSRTYRVTDPGRVSVVAYSIGAIGLVLSVVAFFVDRPQFFHSWLVAFVFWTTLALGGLFFVMLHHLSGSTWSVVLRRIAENVMSLLPLMIFPAIVWMLGIKELYPWTDRARVAADPILAGKTAFLNIPFFYLRTFGYFAIWAILAHRLRRASLAQDNGHTDAIHRRFTHSSAPGMILFALTCTFAAFDWLMSLDPRWYSTIFGVYVFSGAAVSIIAFIIVTVVYLRGHGVLDAAVTVGHYHDLGKLLFTFIIFWAYMAFSQYFLIWYGNIPEETTWFLRRWEGEWKGVSLLLVFGHFVIPFLMLFPYSVKGKPRLLAGIAGWMLLMHWVDVYWMVMPGRRIDAAAPSWIDLGVMMLFAGFCVGRFWRTLTSQPVVPIGDPRLETSIHQHQ